MVWFLWVGGLETRKRSITEVGLDSGPGKGERLKFKRVVVGRL